MEHRLGDRPVAVHGRHNCDGRHLRSPQVLPWISVLEDVQQFAVSGCHIAGKGTGGGQRPRRQYTRSVSICNAIGRVNWTNWILIDMFLLKIVSSSIVCVMCIVHILHFIIIDEWIECKISLKTKQKQKTKQYGRWNCTQATVSYDIFWYFWC